MRTAVRSHYGRCYTRGMQPSAPPLVGIIMGSRSDWETMRHAAETLDRLGVPYEVRVASVHRTPELLRE
jgi:5-(carboxyamino)imidazole ribonucleotide mutase